MFKKALHITLAFYLLTSIIGYTITIHSCETEMVSVQDCPMDDCNCDGACGMCEIETEYIHLATEFVAEQLQKSIDTEIITFSNSLVITINNIFSSKAKTYITTPPKTPDSGQKLALLQSFRC